MRSATSSPPVDGLRRYRTLLEVLAAAVTCPDLPTLFRDLSARLQEVVPSDYVALVLHDPATDTMTRHTLHVNRPVAVDPVLPSSPSDSPSGWVLRNQQRLVIEDLAAETRWPKAIDTIRRFGVRATCIVPLTTAQRPLGTLGFGRMTPVAFTEAEAEFVGEVARIVAVAVQNALNLGRAESLGRQFERERDRLRLLLEVNNAAVSSLELRDLLREVAEPLRRALPHECTSLVVVVPEAGGTALRTLAIRGVQDVVQHGEDQHQDDSPAGRAIKTRSVLRLSRTDLTLWGSKECLRLLAAGVQSMCCVPLVRRDRALGALNAASLRADAFGDDAVDLLEQVASQLVVAIDNATAFRQVAELKDKLTQEKLYLEAEIRGRYSFEEIVGDSKALQDALRQVEIVAATDATVLIRGETGTGKELIARAIHELSTRRDRTLVKVNCAAIPTGLLESELFGHEKGAFTGAIAQKIGRFELADGGTLFLDEVGDIAPELQSKLLRVIQEREFERLGGNRTHKVDVRIVAATHCHLEEMVEQRTFRSDLYYRLSVFPVDLPPLRERREDIPTLVRYFAQKAARRMNRRIETIPAETLETLRSYDWPGNVRELENFVERAVILSTGTVLEAPLAELRVRTAATRPEPAAAPSPGSTLVDVEREHILKVMRETHGVLGGPHGAAARLGMKRTTLQSRLTKLGLRAPR